MFGKFFYAPKGKCEPQSSRLAIRTKEQPKIGMQGFTSTRRNIDTFAYCSLATAFPLCIC